MTNPLWPGREDVSARTTPRARRRAAAQQHDAARPGAEQRGSRSARKRTPARGKLDPRAACASGSSTSTSSRGRGTRARSRGCSPDALDQVELADRLGFDCVWEVEHHFLEEYSHSSASDVFLAAARSARRTSASASGSSPMPPGYQHPARVAETVATLDLVSDGRVEFGTGETSQRRRARRLRRRPRDQARAVGRGRSTPSRA